MPPRPEAPPTVASTYNLLAGVAGQMGGLRSDVDEANRKLDEVLRLQLPAAPPSSAPPSSVSSVPPSSEVLFVPRLPSPDSLTPPPESRPSMAAKAGQAAKTAAPAIGKRILKGAGWLMLIGQAVSFLGRPELGPAVEAIKVIGGALLQLGRTLGGLG